MGQQISGAAAVRAEDAPSAPHPVLRPGPQPRQGGPFPRAPSRDSQRPEGNQCGTEGRVLGERGASQAGPDEAEDRSSFSPLSQGNLGNKRSLRTSSEERHRAQRREEEKAAQSESVKHGRKGR